MNGLRLFNSHPCFAELGQSSLTILKGEEWLNVPLERLPNGRLTAVCKEQVTDRLKALFKHSPWQPRPRVLCALGARGVSLRRLSLPPASKESIPRLLQLQIESEFPLPPDELAWGYRPLPAARSPGNGDPGRQEFLVAALRKESVEEYADIFAAGGAQAAFTLGALARSYLCAQSGASHAMLDIGSTQSELSCFENGLLASIRIIPWGEETITQALAERLGVSREKAQRLDLERKPGGVAERAPGIDAALAAAFDSLADCLNGQVKARRIFLTGRSAFHDEVAAHLNQRLASALTCDPLSQPAGPGPSAAVLGLKTATRNGGTNSLLLLQPRPGTHNARLTQPVPWKLVRVAAILICCLAALPYLQAFALKPFLSRKLASLNADRARLPLIDHELSFLQELKQSQPPYLDALYLLARAAGPGTKIDSLSMNRRGELSLRGSIQGSQQVTDFRSKLIESGFFSNVTVDDQTPAAGPGGAPGGPGGPKLTVRITAQWKPLTARMGLAIGPSAEEIEKAKTRVRDPQPPMPPMMPGGPGMMRGGPPMVSGGPSAMPPLPATEGAGPARISALRRIITPGGLPDRPPTPGEPGSPALSPSGGTNGLVNPTPSPMPSP
jgi:Tfp pilus assembly PilM family ATPase